MDWLKMVFILKSKVGKQMWEFLFSKFGMLVFGFIALFCLSRTFRGILLMLIGYELFCGGDDE